MAHGARSLLAIALLGALLAVTPSLTGHDHPGGGAGCAAACPKCAVSAGAVLQACGDAGSIPIIGSGPASPLPDLLLPRPEAGAPSSPRAPPSLLP